MVGAVIDPGGDLPRIRAAVEELGVTVEKILLTHGHVDHAAGAGTLADLLGVPIEGPHEADRFLIEGLPEQAERFGFGPAIAFEPARWLDEGDEVTVLRPHAGSAPLPRPHAGPCDLLPPPVEPGRGGRRAVPGLGRAHRPARRRPCGADPLDPPPGSGRSARTSPSCRGTGRCPPSPPRGPQNPFVGDGV